MEARILICVAFLVLGFNTSWGEDVPPTAGKINVPFTVNYATGKGTDLVGNISLTNGAGTLEFNNVTFDVIIYEFQDWTWASYYLFDLIGIAQDGSDFGVFYIYSTPSTNQIEFVFYETYYVQINYESASGVVSYDPGSSSVAVNFPGLHSLPSNFDSGFTIAGSQISLENTEGELQYNNERFTILPFNFADCSQCGEEGGWYEIHSMFVPSAREACFGILYLNLNNQNSVTLSYGICLPNLTFLQHKYSATWKGNGTAISE